MFKFTNTDHMRFGPRLVSLIDRKYSAMGQSERRHKNAATGYYLFDEVYHDAGLDQDVAINRDVEYQSLTQLATLRGNATEHVMGHLDPLHLGAYNAMRQASDYIHTIDNDFLSLDKVMPNVTVTATAVASTTPDPTPNPGQGLSGHVLWMTRRHPSR